MRKLNVAFGRLSAASQLITAIVTSQLWLHCLLPSKPSALSLFLIIMVNVNASRRNMGLESQQHCTEKHPRHYTEHYVYNNQSVFGMQASSFVVKSAYQ